MNLLSYSRFSRVDYKSGLAEVKARVKDARLIPEYPRLDKNLYDKKMIELANYLAPKVSTSTSTASSTKLIVHAWPPKTVYPNDGAILPFKRIIAYYGNFYSKGMGVLG